MLLHQDKGRPIRLSNLTFTWRAPDREVGPLVVRASVAYNDAYVTFSSKVFDYKPFPVSTEGCGRNMTCFRVCGSRPRCDAEEAEYMVTMTEEEDDRRGPREVRIMLGGYLRDNQSYIAVGFGRDDDREQMDFVACTKPSMRKK